MSGIADFNFVADLDIQLVSRTLKDQDSEGVRWGRVFRKTYDMIYNGQETGRYRWDQLMKTEKTHFGTLFEINAQREFCFEANDDDPTDYRISNVLVDAKWSQRFGGWMLPPEITDHIALVATADDALSQWSLGLVRIIPEHRTEGANRDKKSTLNVDGKMAIDWLWKGAPMPPNVLLQLPRDVVDNIFDHWAGTERTNRLFRAAEGMIVHRNSVATVSRQLDAQKRVRYNGGARSALAPEGYIILSGKYYPALASALQVPVPGPLEYVSVRVVPTDTHDGVLIDGRRWRRAQEGDVVAESAPILPDRGLKE
ncbi:restriction endonuclease [Pseudarthrobacter sp. NamE2]|uniref:NaeI family type II restriction endonuclease n=1 Tax=Pseudarthrobacter sp. NamE2 TaxID=2576838 RepID=UPI0010FEA2F0|nr:NaeI family type II restriction endonuclease [Pseudarthrobacter sp. NamE2]TLM81935.1 restriction endonuclease [Pseudarthrobacter sp. NamE2]